MFEHARPYSLSKKLVITPSLPRPLNSASDTVQLGYWTKKLTNTKLYSCVFSG